MNLYDISWQLSDLLELERVVYLHAEPEVPDFTTHSHFKLCVEGRRQKVTIEVTPQNVVSVIGLLDATVFNKDFVDRLFLWNIKSIISYFRFYVPKFVPPTVSLLDLKTMEAFNGVKKNRPQNLTEVINRTKVATKTKGLTTVYKKIHLPLSLRVLPSIETHPLLNERERRPEYPYYEIEGQINGRMNCLKKFHKSYLPHNMGAEVKSYMKAPGYNSRFLTADFRHCEVTVLQWLTGDKQLTEMLDSGQDLHRSIYEKITGDKCNSDIKREKSRKMFLPVVYGCGSQNLANVLKVSEGVSKTLIDRMHTTFAEAFKWISEKQEEAKKGTVYDHFGRPRNFDESESYRSRNFVVQAVAATVCAEKLYKLWQVLEELSSYIAFSVHDGYGVVFDMNTAKKTYMAVKESLESESDLCPGLRFKTEIKLGTRLDKMKLLEKK